MGDLTAETGSSSGEPVSRPLKEGDLVRVLPSSPRYAKFVGLVGTLDHMPVKRWLVLFPGPPGAPRAVLLAPDELELVGP